MLVTTTQDVESQIGGKYVLVLAVAKRARQLREGAPVLVQTTSTNPISIALQEIAEGKLKVGLREVEGITPEATRIAEEAERHKPPIPIMVDVREIEAHLAEVEEEEADEEHEEESIEELMIPTGEEDELEHHNEDEDEEIGSEDESLEGIEGGEIVEE